MKARVPHPVISRPQGPVLTVLAFAASCVCAQTQPAEAVPKPAAQEFERITITATRRPELIRDVPASVVSISTSEKEEVGAKNLADLVGAVPGVTVKAGQTTDTSEVVIRGVSTGITSAPGVGFYIDDVPVSASTGMFGNFTFDQRLLDLSRVEVLKGPQGTLYGAGAMGGLVKYSITEADMRALSGRLGAEVSKTRFGSVNYTVNGVMNVPLSADAAAMRVAVFRSRDGGLIGATGPAGGRKLNDVDVTGGRVALTLSPTKQLKVKLAAQTQESEDAGPRNLYDVDPVTLRPVVGEFVRRDLRTRELSTNRSTLVSAGVDYDIGGAVLSSNTGYQRARSRTRLDWSAPYSVFPFGGVLTTDPQAFAYEVDVGRFRKTTQEFRAVSKGKQTIDWLVGVFWTKESGGTVADSEIVGSDPAVPPLVLIQNANRSGVWKETAAYGTVTWNVDPSLALTAGVRTSRNKLSQEITVDGGFFIGPAPLVETKESPTTYLLAARYKLTPTSSLYGRIASGYRAGAPNFTVSDFTTNPPTSFNPPPLESDTLVSYEAGYKAALPNDWGSIDVAVFRIDWKDLQLFAFSSGARYQANAGKARVQGLEFGASLRPAPGLVVRSSFSVMDPKLTEDAPSVNGVSGERLPFSAKVAANLDVRYSFDAAGNPAFVAANVSHVGDRTTSFDANPGVRNVEMPAYTTVNVNAGYSIGNLDLGVYVTNLTDKRGITNVFSALPLPSQPYWVMTTRPRTLGVTAAYSF